MSPVSRTKKFLFSLAVLVTFFILLESALRLIGFEHRSAEVPILIWNPVEDERMKQGRGLHRVDVWSLWAPRPGAKVDWGDNELINEAGWRGPLLARQRRPGVLRIATLGDSSTFGMGVAYADSYPAQLERILNERGTRAEVQNAGVVGFTARQGLERYKSLVRQYQPDVVVAAFGAVNEHFPCSSLADALKIQHSQRALVWWRRQSDRLRRELRVLQFANWLAFEARGGQDAADRRLDEWARRDNELRRTIGQEDWPGQRRVPLDDFDRALTELRDAVESDGARLILVCMPRAPLAERELPVLRQYSQRLIAVARREQLPLLNARGLFLREFRAGRSPQELFYDRWHPSRAGHELIASMLASIILDVRRGSIPLRERTHAEPSRSQKTDPRALRMPRHRANCEALVSKSSVRST